MGSPAPAGRFIPPAATNDGAGVMPSGALCWFGGRSHSHGHSLLGLRSRALVWTRSNRFLIWIVAGSAVLYSWGLAGRGVHPYYSAAVRSMSSSWHNFAYGAFDPAGTLSVDKVPGALWVQSLFVRIFGYHSWAILLPGVIAMTVSVVVLYDTVRRWSGKRAGLYSTVIFATSPAIVGLARVNVPDGLMILALLCATNAFTRALNASSRMPLMWCGIWVGVAFQMKMLQALLVLPVFVVAYMLCATPGIGRRLVHCTELLGIALALSAAWPILVSSTPAPNRPFIDGSAHNSAWELVFGYNALGRFNADPTTFGTTGNIHGYVPAAGGHEGWLRLFEGSNAIAMAWLLPLALVVVGAALLFSRRAGRNEATAGWIVWALWLLGYGAVFSVATGIQPYYTATLAPAVAALVGTGLVVAIRWWQDHIQFAWLGLPAILVTTTAWSFVVMFDNVGRKTATAIVIGITALGALAVLLSQTCASLTRMAQVGADLRRHAGALCLFTLLLGPSTVVLSTFSSSRTQLTFAETIPLSELGTARVQLPRGLTDAQSDQDGKHAFVVNKAMIGFISSQAANENAFATTDASFASPYIIAGYNVLPFGGFTGTAPNPTVPTVVDLVQAGSIRFVIRVGHGPVSRNPAGQWVITHCQLVQPAVYASPSSDSSANSPSLYDCEGMVEANSPVSES